MNVLYNAVMALSVNWTSQFVFDHQPVDISLLFCSLCLYAYFYLLIWDCLLSDSINIYVSLAAIWFLFIPFRINCLKTIRFSYNPIYDCFRLVLCTWLLSGESPFCYLLFSSCFGAECRFIWIQNGAPLCSSLPLCYSSFLNVSAVVGRGRTISC